MRFLILRQPLTTAVNRLIEEGHDSDSDDSDEEDAMDIDDDPNAPRRRNKLVAILDREWNTIAALAVLLHYIREVTAT